jgi:hypothetical protein
MTTLTELIKHDNVQAHWFWTHSVSTGPYDQYEVYDVVFVRNTDETALNGGNTRTTLHLRGISDCTANGMNKHGGKLIYPDPVETLAHVVADAHIANMYRTFAGWADDQRDMSLSYREALADFEDWEIHRARHAEISRWLGQEDSDAYDEYVKAAQKYAAEH